jgi:nucleotidyltransferase/DNA polymerase involved in DNA repair
LALILAKPTLMFLAQWGHQAPAHHVEAALVVFRVEAHDRQRMAVLQWTGIPVSIGIAPTKTLAKVANRFAKKDPERDGVMLLLDEAAQDGALARMDLTDLWGIAGRLAARHAAHRNGRRAI